MTCGWLRSFSMTSNHPQRAAKLSTRKAHAGQSSCLPLNLGGLAKPLVSSDIVSGVVAVIGAAVGAGTVGAPSDVSESPYICCSAVAMAAATLLTLPCWDVACKPCSTRTAFLTIACPATLSLNGNGMVFVALGLLASVAVCLATRALGCVPGPTTHVTDNIITVK